MHIWSREHVLAVRVQEGRDGVAEVGEGEGEKGVPFPPLTFLSVFPGRAQFAFPG